jgi:dienelactone hydrolase
MHERVIEIPTADGRMETFITHPEEGGPFASVVIYTEGFDTADLKDAKALLDELA